MKVGLENCNKSEMSKNVQNSNGVFTLAVSETRTGTGTDDIF